MAYGLVGALAHLADRLPGALADVADRLPGALADVLDGALAALADVLDRLAGAFQRPAGAAADLLDRVADALQELRVAIQRGEYSPEDHRDVVEPRLEQRLRLDALDVQLDLAEPRRDAHVELDQVLQLGANGDRRPEVLDLDVDFVHLDDRDVEHDVGPLVNVIRIDDLVIGIVLALLLLR